MQRYMSRKLKAASTVTLILLFTLASLAQDKRTVRSGVPIRTGIYDPAIDIKAESLLRKMTLEEKVGQLVQYSAGQPTGPGTGRTDYNDMIAKGQIGALFNISTAHQVNVFQHIA